ncbi:putative uncharacterized protein [Roseburia sp. CAG:309]|nr:putative uncharacterized protein [Roseburia sp. CAG:309]
MEENEQSVVIQSDKKGFGIAGLILGIVSILCCMCLGAGLVFSIIGGIFSIISVIKGSGTGRTLGIIGLVLNILGLVLNAFMIVSFAMMIDWSNVTVENLQSINNIDPNNENEVMQWMQQFFRVDISSY